MAMVEVPGGSDVGGRNNHGRRTTTTTPRKLPIEGRLEKKREIGVKVPTDGEDPNKLSSMW